MLRLVVIVLLLANLGYYAWAQGALRTLGWGPALQSEPERVQQQLRPDAVRLARPAGTALPASAAAPPSPAPVNAARAPAAPASSTECLQAGPLDERQAEALRRQLAGLLPASAWTLEASTTPGRWMVYMGRFADAEALDKKRVELRGLGVSYDRPGAALEPGLSLGRFSTPEAAERGLADLGRKGVRSAKVVQERPENTSFTLRLPAIDAAQRGALEGLAPTLAGKPLQRCS